MEKAQEKEKATNSAAQGRLGGGGAGSGGGGGGGGGGMETGRAGEPQNQAAEAEKGGEERPWWEVWTYWQREEEEQKEQEREEQKAEEAGQRSASITDSVMEELRQALAQVDNLFSSVFDPPTPDDSTQQDGSSTDKPVWEDLAQGIQDRWQSIVQAPALLGVWESSELEVGARKPDEGRPEPEGGVDGVFRARRQT